MQWGLGNNNKLQLKRGKLIIANGTEYDCNYEELTPRSYTQSNDFINGMDYIKALQTIRTSRELPNSAGAKFETEEKITYTVKTMTPEIDGSKSRFAKNTKSWVINLGE